MTDVFCDECGAKGVLAGGEVMLSCDHKKAFFVPFEEKKDLRSSFEKMLWNLIGPPLYYCEECKLQVRVTINGIGKEPTIKRDKRCNHTGQIIAPRKAICVGKGGASLQTKAKVNISQFLSSLTNRSV